MPLIRAAGRAALAWVFVSGGVDVVRHPEGRAEVSAPLLDRVRAAAPVELPDDVVLVRLNAAAQVVAAGCLALGFFPRVAAGVLAASLVPTTIGGHPFWTVSDPKARAGQRIHLNKNVAIIGGLVLFATSRAVRRATDG